MAEHEGKTVLGGKTAAGQPHPSAQTGIVADPELKPDPGLEAATHIAEKGVETDKAGKVSSTEDEERVADATSWLLAAYDTPEDVTHVIELNVGTGTKPVWLPWTIKSVDGSLIRRIRSRAADSIGDSRSRMSAASNVEAAFRSNLEVIVEGTVDPDLREAAQARNIADATVIVEGALRNKQGLVDQVAGAIYALSGYDEEDVRDQVEQAAARSS